MATADNNHHSKRDHERKTKKGEKPLNHYWHTQNERSGTIGIKWYCGACGYMMVYPKNVNPNSRSKL